MIISRRVPKFRDEAVLHVSFIYNSLQPVYSDTAYSLYSKQTVFPLHSNLYLLLGHGLLPLFQASKTVLPLRSILHLTPAELSALISVLGPGRFSILLHSGGSEGQLQASTQVAHAYILNLQEVIHAIF